MCRNNCQKTWPHLIHSNNFFKLKCNSLIITNPITHQGRHMKPKPLLRTSTAFIGQNTLPDTVDMGLLWFCNIWRLLFSPGRLQKPKWTGGAKKHRPDGVVRKNGPGFQWNLTSVFPLDVKMKCNTDINVASITTQWRNVNWSAGTSGGKLSSCGREAPPPVTARLAARPKWPLEGTQVSGYSPGEGAGFRSRDKSLCGFSDTAAECVCRVQGERVTPRWLGCCQSRWIQR